MNPAGRPPNETPEPVEVVRKECPSCGTDQELVREGKSPPRCIVCGKPMAIGESVPVGVRPKASLPSSHVEVHAVDAVSDEEADEQLSRLSAGKSRASEEVDHLIAFEKRSRSILTMVPIFGTIRIWQSEAHSLPEKALLSAASLVVTVALGFGIWGLLPGKADRVAVAEARLGSDLEALAGLVRRYHQRYGAYPDPATWVNSAERGDSRFYDPWGRVYVFRERKDGFSLGTFGEDGAPGGAGADEDRFTRFQP